MALKYVLRNCSIFVDGYGLHGATAQLSLPKLAEKVEEHRGGGMDGPIELALGIEKLEAHFDLADLEPNVMKLWGLAPGQTKAFTFKGHLAGEDGSDRGVEVHTRGSLKELDFGDWKPGEKATLKSGMRLNYYKLTIGDEALIEIDIMAGIRIIGGIDQNISMRRNLGMA